MREIVLLLVVLVDNVLVLASELVEDKIDARLASLLNHGSVLDLLAVSVHLSCVLIVLELLGLAHASVHVHVAKLLSSQGKKLLLELLLPLSEIHLSSQQLSSDTRIHLAIVELKRGRSQDLVVHWLLLLRLLLLVLVHTSEARTDGSLGTLVGTVEALPVAVVAVGVVSTNIVLALGVWC